MESGFEITVRVGEAPEVRLYHAGGPASSARPLVSSAGGPGSTIAVLIGRIHYREDLTTPGWSEPGASDAAVALAFFRSRGVEGLGALEGEFALVLLKPRRGEAVAVRRPPGELAALLA